MTIPYPFLILEMVCVQAWVLWLGLWRKGCEASSQRKAAR